jgi:NADPH:quinone reductase-like Zn-dependent oxidoreductase
MRALLLTDHADRPRTRLADWADPVPGDGEVRVRIEATALNPLDAKIATGAMADWFPVALPYVPGTDFAGIVEAVGAGVIDLAVGDTVLGRADPVEGGAIAARIVLEATRVARRPDGLSAMVAACLPTPAGVALQVLEVLTRDSDEPLLILGDGMVARMASALAGTAAVQVTDAADIGEPGRFGHAIDTVGGVLQRAAVEKLAIGGHLVTLTAPVDPAAAAARQLRADFVVLDTSRRQLDALALAADDGVLLPRIDHIVPFDEAALAFDRYVARALSGKIVIEGAPR